MKKPKLNSEIQREFKDKMRSNGFKQITIWIHPDNETSVRKFSVKMRDKNERSI